MNGFELNCATSTFSKSFGVADQVLQNAGKKTYFFDYCSVFGVNSSIEDLGDSFGKFLNGLGEDQVDVIAYSTGGLILRSYLSGKSSGTFHPPENTHIRKIVFLATPHFGVGLTAGLPFSAGILTELASGSQFLFDLATWNQGTEDLRGIDAIQAVGNAGTGLATTKGFDDGLVALTSASLGFVKTGRTRVLPYCHTDGTGLLGMFGFCPQSATGIAKIGSETDPVARLIVSFLAGTNDWQTVGNAAEQDAFLSKNGGLDVAMRDANDTRLTPNQVAAASAAQNKNLNIAPAAYTDMFAANPVTLNGTSGSVKATTQMTLPATIYKTVVLKPGPVIAGIAPAAAKVIPLGAAAGEIVSIYGTSLDGATVTMGGSSMQILFSSATLLNAVIPDGVTGYTPLTVANDSGRTSVNILMHAAVPAVFTLDQSGSGAAAAVDATGGYVIDSSHPLHVGDYLSLYLTGLGATTRINGLDYANQKPAVTIAGKDCPVTYAGRAPGFSGLDQINCLTPPIGSQGALEVVVTSGDRVSNVTTVQIQ